MPAVLKDSLSSMSPQGELFLDMSSNSQATYEESMFGRGALKKGRKLELYTESLSREWKKPR